MKYENRGDLIAQTVRVQLLVLERHLSLMSSKPILLLLFGDNRLFCDLITVDIIMTATNKANPTTIIIIISIRAKSRTVCNRRLNRFFSPSLLFIYLKSIKESLAAECIESRRTTSRGGFLEIKGVPGPGCSEPAT
jgi:hypothetical protein